MGELREESFLRRVLPRAWLAVVVMAAALLPWSYLTNVAVGVNSWRGICWGFMAGSVPGSGQSGWAGGLDDGYFWVYVYGPAPNPNAVLPGPRMTQIGIDDSEWVGSLRHEVGAGRFVMGSVFRPDWEARSGVVFPFWPLSVGAGAILVLRWRRGGRPVQVGTLVCFGCGYDLRAHCVGGRCPVCGLVI